MNRVLAKTEFFYNFSSKLLEKLLDVAPFANSKPGTLAYYWYRHGGLGCTLHVPNNMKIKMTPPKHLYEYDDWCKMMKSEQFSWS